MQQGLTGIAILSGAKFRCDKIALLHSNATKYPSFSPTTTRGGNSLYITGVTNRESKVELINPPINTNGEYNGLPSTAYGIRPPIILVTITFTANNSCLFAFGIMKIFRHDAPYGYFIKHTYKYLAAPAAEATDNQKWLVILTDMT